MAEPVRDFFTRYARAINDLDFVALEPLIHPDFIGFYPQSGERFHGFAALKAQLEKYPGGLDDDWVPESQATLFGDEEHWVISPGYTVLPLAGPQFYTMVLRAVYPDRSKWWVVAIVELKDGKIYRTDTYFALDFDPPEWRRDMVEIVPRD